MDISCVKVMSSIGNAFLPEEVYRFQIPQGVALNNGGWECASLRKDEHTLHMGLLRVRETVTVCGWQ